MDPLITFIGAATVGAIAAWVATNQQNALAAFLVFGLGAGILLVISGASLSGGPAGTIEDFPVASGVPGLLGAIVGAIAGGYLGDRQRTAKPVA
ncbi:MAG: hypothetical protein ABIZ52_05520 [Candidatus Limnocylindrales bacterium]